MDEFYEVLDDLRIMFKKKNQDYGVDDDPLANVNQSEKWGIPPWVGAMNRVGDKIVRLQKYARDGKLANEGVEDSLLDIAVYTVIALVLFREEAENAATVDDAKDPISNAPVRME